MKKEKNVLLLTLSFKKCACCGEVKPTTEFSRKKHRDKWGFYAYCKDMSLTDRALSCFWIILLLPVALCF